jgi:hypothetical protein
MLVSIEGAKPYSAYLFVCDSPSKINPEINLKCVLSTLCVINHVLAFLHYSKHKTTELNSRYICIVPPLPNSFTHTHAEKNRTTLGT